MVIDDESSIRAVLRMLIETLGHEATVASDGRTGVELFQSALLPDQEPFRIVITDLVMKGMKGDDVKDAIRQLRPKTKVVLCTGYSNEPMAMHPQDHGFDGALIKPFDKDYFARLIGELLLS